MPTKTKIKIYVSLAVWNHTSVADITTESNIVKLNALYFSYTTAFWHQFWTKIVFIPFVVINKKAFLVASPPTCSIVSNYDTIWDKSPLTLCTYQGCHVIPNPSGPLCAALVHKTWHSPHRAEQELPSLLQQLWTFSALSGITLLNIIHNQKYCHVQKPFLFKPNLNSKIKKKTPNLNRNIPALLMKLKK